VNSEGTTLSADVNIGSGAVGGIRIVVVVTPTSRSLTANIGTNAFTVQ
jgi:hypothetical protein